MKQGIIVGAVLIVAGIGLFAYYDRVVRYEREAREMLTEGKLIFERGSREAINDSINIFSRLVARYPGTHAESEAYFYIAQSYEKMKLNRLAYLKYIYILKDGRNLAPGLEQEIRARLARLKVMKRYSEEGIHQLLELLNYSDSREFRSRVYTELGHTYLQMADYRKSKRMFDIALSENGDNEEAILGKARAYKRLGYDNLAYDTYEYFLKYYGNFSHYADDVRNAYMDQAYRSGHVSYRRGRYSAAIGYFKRIIGNFPDTATAENSLYWTGQCYYAMKKYNTAIGYYNRVLGNDFVQKDEDARIRKGYAYFAMQKFDLSAREFQIYINAYPGGRYIGTAKKWKSASTQELLYKIQNKMIPDEEEEDEDFDGGSKGGGGARSGDANTDSSDKAMTGGAGTHQDDYIEYENVGEL